MDTLKLLRIVWRWIWVVLLVVLVSGGVLITKLATAPPVYEATVKLQFTAPSPATVALYDQYRSTNLRDDMTVASNNFTELLQSREVYVRAVTQLGLTESEALYDLSATQLRDSDFLYITVRASSARLAEEIANTTVSVAIAYYGEVSAKPTTATGDSIRAQLSTAEKQFRAAEEDLAAFQNDHNITSLDSELGIYNNLLEQLETARNQLLVDGKSTAALDAAIATRRSEIADLLTLAPTYNVLEENEKQARAGYELLLEKYQEAVLKEDNVRAASFVQVVEQAIEPPGPAPAKVQASLALAIVGSLGLGVLLALLLEWISTHRPRRKQKSTEEPVPAGAAVKLDYGYDYDYDLPGHPAQMSISSKMEHEHTRGAVGSPWFRR